jgi:hypothetical protein
MTGFALLKHWVQSSRGHKGTDSSANIQNTATDVLLFCSNVMVDALVIPTPVNGLQNSSQLESEIFQKPSRWAKSISFKMLDVRRFASVNLILWIQQFILLNFY